VVQGGKFMKNFIPRQIFSISLLLILLITFIPGCTSPGTDIKVDLVFSEPPALNKPVTLTETFTLRKDFPSPESRNMGAHIYLPDGFVKVDGDLEWSGTLNRGETKTISVTVKSIRTGSFQIEANAGWFSGYTSGAPGSGGGKTIFVTVSENGATVSDRVPTVNGTSTATTWGNTSNTYSNPPGTTTQSFTGPTPTPTVTISHSPGTDIKVDLVFSEPPALDKPVILTETFTLRKDFYSEVAENITAHIYLPDGFE
jgi:hypothetical protein